jgi:hypothetical protein
MSKVETREMRKLESNLRSSLAINDFASAKRCIARITTLLRKSRQETRSLKYKNAYFEAVMESGDVTKAIDAFHSIRTRAPKGTRVRLEANTLLAIAYLRANQPANAKPLILEVMRDETVIQSAARRKEFRRRAYERFDQEIVLAACRGIGHESLDVKRIASEAEKLALGTETTVLKALADATPGEATVALRNVDSFTIAQLPHEERKLLTSGKPTNDEEFVADTLFKAFRRVLYPSFCDPHNDFYRNFFNRPLTAATTSGSIAAAVGKYMQSIHVGLTGLAVGVTAMLIKLGVATLCERYKPENVLVDFR